jgi:hypothetical protein
LLPSDVRHHWLAGQKSPRLRHFCCTKFSIHTDRLSD